MERNNSERAASFDTEAGTLPPWARWWLKLWLQHPRRVFWLLDPATGLWEEI